MFFRLEAIEKIEEALTGLKVIDFGGNYIRVSLRTCIPPVEDLLCQPKAEHDIKLHEVSHELQIDVMDGSMELKNVEVECLKLFHVFISHRSQP